MSMVIFFSLSKHFRKISFFFKNFFVLKKGKIFTCMSFIVSSSTKSQSFKMIQRKKTQIFQILRSDFKVFKLFQHRPHKMVKHTQTIHQQQPTSCLSVFDHFVGFALKGLSSNEVLRNNNVSHK